MSAPMTEPRRDLLSMLLAALRPSFWRDHDVSWLADDVEGDDNFGDVYVEPGQSVTVPASAPADGNVAATDGAAPGGDAGAAE